MVAERASIPFVEIPEQHKRRQYIVGSHAAKTDRAHAMIVTYVGDTETGLHHHPNAESMFVLLDGALDFVVNGETVQVSPGQVTYFGMNDVHALRPSAGGRARGVPRVPRPRRLLDRQAHRLKLAARSLFLASLALPSLAAEPVTIGVSSRSFNPGYANMWIGIPLGLYGP